MQNRKHNRSPQPETRLRRTASHEKEEVHPRSANRETKRELSNAQRNLGRDTQRGDWVLTPPLKRLLFVILEIESISKILQLRLESLRLESLGVDVSTELVG